MNFTCVVVEIVEPADYYGIGEDKADVGNYLPSTPISIEGSVECIVGVKNALIHNGHLTLMCLKQI